MPPRRCETSADTPPLFAERGDAAPARAAPRTALRWTDAQRRGITTTGRSLLVSAAAGSGKTTILAERCLFVVCDAPEPCDIDELLVVTFTEAAAQTMKSRIHAALQSQAAERDSERLRRQLDLIDHAQISTLHSFCARLLREHFHAVGLDPAFDVLDGQEAALLRRQVARKLFDQRYEQDPSGDFQRFVEAYGQGDDAHLIRRVIQTHELLRSLIDPDQWLERSRRRVAEAGEQPLRSCELGQELLHVLCQGLAQIRQDCGRAIEMLKRLGEFPTYVDALCECDQVLCRWERMLADNGIDALADEARAHQFSALGRVANSVPGKEQAKKAVDEVRQAMTQGAWRDLLSFTVAEWQEGLRAIRPHVEVFLDLVAEFRARYRQAKEMSRAVDFADLEHLALEVLRDEQSTDGTPVPRERAPGPLRPSAAARAFHRRFAHVLVDEYQDINEVQDAILWLLSRESAPQASAAPNLFCVGDVKQSIYRFRLAEAQRFLARQKTLRSQSGIGQVIDLQSNFRSRGPLLEAINGVFERLMTASAVDIEYDRSHRLEPGLTYPVVQCVPSFSGAPIEMHLLPSRLEDSADDPDAQAEQILELDRSEREALLAAQRVLQLFGGDGSPPVHVMEKDDRGQLRPRPIRFGDIAILLRSMKYKSEQYADIFRRCGIPVYAQSSTGYFESTEVRDMLALLSVLHNQRQDIPLAAVLRSPLAGLAQPEDALARVRLAFESKGPQAVPFHDAVVRYARQKDDELAAWLRQFLAQLERWRHIAHSRPLAELIRTIYSETSYVEFCSALHDGQQRAANLRELHRLASQFGTFHRQGLSQFLEFLDGLRAESDLGQPSALGETDDVVRVMSIHRAKGLEFPVVLLPDLGKRINLSDCHGPILADRDAGLGMAVVDTTRIIRYPSLASVLVERRLRQQVLAEEMRVLYVAMTRAREHLILIGTCDEKEPDKWDQKWSGHPGALPAQQVLGARSMLDWLGPAAAAAAASGPPAIQITRHCGEEVADWGKDYAPRPALSEQQARLAALELLEPPPLRDAGAAAAISRLEFVYPFEPFTRLATADAATRRSGATHASAAEPAMPRFMCDPAAVPCDAGLAMHRVLAHLDFGRPCDRADLDEQIASMVQRNWITEAQAAAVCRDDILWLMQSEVGGLLRQHASTLLRELPFHLSTASTDAPCSNDPQDKIMVRGRIDVLIPLTSGAILIDYKTEQIPAGDLPARPGEHSPQMAIYRQAIERMTGRSPAKSYLVFTAARQVHGL